MAGKPKRSFAAQPVADLATGILDPVLRKRAGISVALVQSWEEIVGERIANGSRPEKIVWSRRASEDVPFDPATLVVACQGLAALMLQHETGQVIARVNGFLGFGAVGRIRIVQKPVSAPAPKRSREPARPSAAERARLDDATAEIENEGLRDALLRLGAEVSRERRRA